MKNALPSLRTSLDSFANTLLPLNQFVTEFAANLADFEERGIGDDGRERELFKALMGLRETTQIFSTARHQRHDLEPLSNLNGLCTAVHGLCSVAYQVAERNEKAAEQARLAAIAKKKADEAAEAAEIQRQADFDAETIALRIRLLGHA